jgi:GNAT superfamily N-acetyltransferase
MSIPYDVTIDRVLTSQNFYGMFVDDELVAMGGIQIMTRKPENRIIHLCVKQDKRKHGYGQQLVQYLANILLELDNNNENIVYFKDGAENNGFCKKYVKEEEITKVQLKSMTLLRCKLDFDKILPYEE